MKTIQGLVLASAIVGNRWFASAAQQPATCQAVVRRDIPQSQTERANGSFCEETLTLRSNGEEPSIIIIDHGEEVGGLPTFQVLSATGNTSILEVSYSETRALLDKYMSDGPLPLSAALDTYRINRYNITANTTYKNRLIQGGQRYQKLNLSTAGELVLQNVGIVSTVSLTPVTDLPGSFQCSDQSLNRVWNAGARTLQYTEFPAQITPEFYQISDQGLFVESQAPQPYSSDTAPFLMQYHLDFSAKPTMGGFGFTVLSDTLGSGIYIFVNAANSSISAHEGSTERDGPALAWEMLDPTLAMDEWHKVSSTVNTTDIKVSIAGKSVLSFTQTSKFAGSFGLGASFGHAAYFQNVTMKTLDGQTIYQSSLTERSILDDFIAGTNTEPVSVDGARRDRIVYAGDVDITLGPTFASTHGSEYTNGTINLIGASQLLPGFFVPNLKIQQVPRTDIIPVNMTGLIGYSFSLVTAMSEFYFMTGDIQFARRWAPSITKMLDWADSQTTSLGLFNVSDATLGGDWNYYDPPQTGAVTKFNCLYAFALKQSLPLLSAANVSTQIYIDRLAPLKSAINAVLWNPTLKAYQLSDSSSETIPQDGNAFAVLANIPQGNITGSTILNTMSRELFVPAGALPFSNASAAHGFTQSISPYASGYHLRAAFAAHDQDSAKHLLSTLWASMANPSNANYTGTFWETLTVTGEPGLGDTTSLCHAWSTAPTGELSRNVLGIQATSPGFAQWAVVPQTLGLDWANGTHPTPHGGLFVSWAFDEQGRLSMNVTSPDTTSGTINLPTPLRRSLESSTLQLNGKIVSGSSFNVTGGTVFQLIQLDSAVNSSKAASISASSLLILPMILWLMVWV